MEDIRSLENKEVDGEVSIHEQLMNDRPYTLQCVDCKIEILSSDGYTEVSPCPDCSGELEVIG